VGRDERWVEPIKNALGILTELVAGRDG
jgi:hypothetical protein